MQSVPRFCTLGRKTAEGGEGIELTGPQSRRQMRTAWVHSLALAKPLLQRFQAGAVSGHAASAAHTTVEAQCLRWGSPLSCTPRGPLSPNDIVVCTAEMEETNVVKMIIY